MDKYEYYTFAYDTRGLYSPTINLSDIQGALNELGREGWELVSTTPIHKSTGMTGNIIYYFKRRLY